MVHEKPVEASSMSRRSHRKVRSGCRTCKTRRVKCDEGFPACYRCVSTARVCDGYGIWGGGGAVHQGRSKPTQSTGNTTSENTLTGSSSTALLVIRATTPLSPGPRVSAEEQTYLEWFLHGTATHTPRIFNSPFWDPVILQMTIHEPMVLNALLALSSAHKRKILDPANRAREGVLPDTQEIFLLKQYGGAVKKLQSFLAEGREKGMGRERVLVGCIMCSLLVLIEMMRGRYEVGYLHLANGAQWAKQLPDKADKPEVNLKLEHFFPRMLDQFEMHRIRKRASSPASTTKTLVFTPTLRFEDVAEAGHHLDDLVSLLTHAAEQTRLLPPSATAAMQVSEEDFAYARASFESWLSSYKATIAESEFDVDGAEGEAWKALRQRYDMVVGRADIGLVGWMGQK